MLAAPSTHLSAPLGARAGSVSIGNRYALAPAGGFLEASGRVGAGAVEVVLSTNGSIDTRGVFINRVLEPGNVAGQGFVNGGPVTIDSSQQVVLAPGSGIDASSGGAVLSSQKSLAGRGGAISITAWDPADPNLVPLPASRNFQIAATLRAYGSAKGGGLSLNVPAVFIGDDPALAPAGSLDLTPGFFSAGFSSYSINGYNGVAVAPGSRIAVSQPVYQFGPASLRAPTGSDPAAAFDLVLPAVFTPDPVAAQLTQRVGASLTLASLTHAGSSNVAGGSVIVGDAASITVDPGAAIAIEAFGQITVNGSLIAPGGAISVLNDRAQANALGQYLTYQPGLSIWLGPAGVLDVSARAATALDTYGRPFGAVPAGGSIRLGSAGGTLGDGPVSTDALLLTRPGSRLDASGASAVIDAYAGTTPLLSSLHGPSRIGGGGRDLAVVVGSNGGSITLHTESGADLQGKMRAAAGGAGAEGGTLSLTLVTPAYKPGQVIPDFPVPDALRMPREVTIGQSAQASPLPADLKPGDSAVGLTFGQVRLAADPVRAGGFDTLAISSGDGITFDGSVALQAGRAIRITTGVIGETYAGAAVRIAAPYVGLTGLADTTGGTVYAQFPAQNSWAPSSQSAAAALSVIADTIDIAGNFYGGIRRSIGLAALAPDGSATTRTIDRRGFNAIALGSSGDIRFRPGPAGGGTSLTTPGNLLLTAGQVYPVAGTQASVTAGFDFALAGSANPFRPDGVIRLERSSGPTPPAPLTAGGSLALRAGEIDQGGILRAPQGQITLGAIGGGVGMALGDAAFTSTVRLLPGSVTSVSAAGLSIPYGGTSDGITYTINGTPIAAATPTIALNGQTLSVGAGATLDLSGGGQLTGSAFIFGRGGSTDVLTSPLLRITAAGTVSAPDLSTNPVYAILPGANPSVAAPASTAASYAGSMPKPGDQISIGDGVPGLPAGSYTLLPGSDALLPGAFRVELNTARAALLTGPLALDNGSTLVNGYRGVAGTAFRDALPVVLTVSSGAAVRRYAQYNEETYSQYATALATLFGKQRRATAEDAKRLTIAFPSVVGATAAFTQSGTVLFQPAAGGYGGSAIIAAATDLEIAADGALPTAGFVSLRASDLNRLGVSTLAIGGFAQAQSIPSQLKFQLGVPDLPSTTQTPSVTLRTGTVLSAPQVFLVGGRGGITIKPGASINTLGLGAPAFDAANGFIYNNNNNAIVAVSNGVLAFQPPTTGVNYGPVSIGVCALPPCAGSATLYSDGTIGLVTGGSVTLDPSTRYGTRVLDLGVASVNIGSTAALAGVPLPAGLTLDNEILGRLLSGDPAVGAPAVQQLRLTANQSVNFYGSINLDTVNPVTGQSSLKLLQFNSPAIYGAGAATDVVNIATGMFVWNGLATTVATATGDQAVVSAAPGGVVAGGAGTGAGRFAVRADRILLGYGPGEQPDNNTRLDRLMLGFADVMLTGNTSIATGNRGSLAVYQSQTTTYLPATGFVKTGGDLTLATPALIGGAGSVNAILAGGALRIAAAAGAAPAGTAQAALAGSALGAEIDLIGNTIETATTIALPSGRLTLSAIGDVTLGAGTRIDAAGRQIPLFDQTRATFGGDVVLTSAAGNVIQRAGASIDVSAIGADAGSLTITATAPGAGQVALGGPIAGSAGAGFIAGLFDVRAQGLDFDAINATLNVGGVVGSRSFDIKTGDLVIGDGLIGRKINVAVDGGSLMVTGTIAANGVQPGSIRLAARDGLTMAGTAVLDAHGTALRVDSAGQPIAAANRGEVELTSAAGSLTLASGAVIDLSTPDGVAYGRVVLNAPRSGPDDVAVQAPNPVGIRGAASIALNAVRGYTPTDSLGTITQHDMAIAGSVVLDRADADSTAFLRGADLNAGLLGRLAGLRAYGVAFHLRPGVEIDSSAASGGNLTVTGDLDLSGYRYKAYRTAPGVLAEPGALVLRASDNLRVFGSITDGFGQPPDPGFLNPDDHGWIFNLNAGGVEVTGSRIVLSSPATLQGSTNPADITLGRVTGFVNNDVALNYDIHVYGDGNGVDGLGNPAAEGAALKANVAVPGAVTLEINSDGTLPVVPAGTVLTAAVTLPGGAVYPGGTIVAAGGLVLAPGTVLDAGSRLPVQVTLAVGTLWPAGASLAGFAAPVLLSASTAALPAGSLIPAGTSLALGACCATRPSGSDGTQGAIYAIAPMLGVLADGSLPQSWSLRLVGGADLASADTRGVAAAATLPAATGGDPQPGSIVLSDLHYQIAPSGATPPAWSVIRTGTGDLELLAGGGVQQNSLFGIYTAGNAGPANAGINLARGTLPGASSVLGSLGLPYEPLVTGANYQAYFPDRGGDVLIAAQGSISGNLLVPTAQGSAAIDGVGNWLWRQGGGGQDTAWWINFGTYAVPLDARGQPLAASPVLTGFIGIGALAGGNVRILAGGNVGGIAAQLGGGGYDVSQALDVAIGATGHVIAAANGQKGTVLATGGGDLTIRAGGAFNPADPIRFGAMGNPTGYPSADTALGGTLTDLRGQINVRAGSVGQVVLQYGLFNSLDPRSVSPLVANAAASQGGPVVVPGDASAVIMARGDVVLGGVGDATRLGVQNLTPLGGQAGPGQSATQASGLSWFSLWQPETGIALLSAGGNATPSTQALASASAVFGAPVANSQGTDGRFLFPPVLDVTAASGSIYYGIPAFSGPPPTDLALGLELAPAARGRLALLAVGSIYGNQYGGGGGSPQTIAISGADPSATASPRQPAYGNGAASPSPLSLFAFGPDTASGVLHVGDAEPAQFYAGQDIVNLRFGEIACATSPCSYGIATRLVAGKAAAIRAGQDIVGFGLAPGVSADQQARLESTTGNVILNNDATDISVLAAGRDILYANLAIVGPGSLFVSAGRNLYQADQGVLESTGTLHPDGQSRAGGAGITVLAGVGANGPDFSGFANAYLDIPNPHVSAGAPGVIQSYGDQVLGFVQTRYGYQGNVADALAFFQGLPAEQRAGLLLQVYFDELRASGREFTDSASPRYKSYARGRKAIDALFPDPPSYHGDITLFGGSGVRSDFGGAINLLTPGGQTVLGVASGPQPPASAGVLTQGQGDIGIYSLGSVLLGQSRVFTTFGGGIVIWSASGDVNAGRGAKSTAVYTPSRIVYDAYGNILLAPSVPTSGAGIATLSPIPGTSAGDVDLIAPLGTIDAGEAGIRVSGNINLAALTVSNASNVQVQGKSTGLPTVVAPNVGALSAATAASAAASQAAQQSTQNSASPGRQTPSTITVEITGYGG